MGLNGFRPLQWARQGGSRGRFAQLRFVSYDRCFAGAICTYPAEQVCLRIDQGSFYQICRIRPHPSDDVVIVLLDLCRMYQQI